MATYAPSAADCSISNGDEIQSTWICPLWGGILGISIKVAVPRIKG